MIKWHCMNNHGCKEIMVIQDGIEFAFLIQKHMIIPYVCCELVSSFLSSCHEKTIEALYIGRIHTRLGLVFVS